VHGGVFVVELVQGFCVRDHWALFVPFYTLV
jgi:hypothetical protein